MNYKSHIVSIIVCLLSAPVFAQIEQDIIRPSINADQFSIGAKTETALTKGQLSVNIPLMELKGKGYNLPISLSFYGGDVTYSTEASPVGLGWALIAGGVITKTIKGSDDTANDGINREHHYNDDFLHNSINIYNCNELLYKLDDVRMDPMPDEYTYSLPGHNGTIDVSVNDGVITKKLYPDESYRIEDSGRGVCITADDGTKFYFEDIEESQIIDRTSSGNDTHSASLFLSRIVTTKGGVFTFNYAQEEYFDLLSSDESYNRKYCTKRITSIVSDYGSITFSSVQRNDRGEYGYMSITTGRDSERINKIELRDENGDFIKGYELDNSGWFTYTFAPENKTWSDIRHKLSSITQYDSIGNRLPPYEFDYSYRFSRSRLVGSFTGSSQNIDNLPKDSWTSPIGAQAFANLDSSGNPTTLLMLPNAGLPDIGGEVEGPTVNDFFCLSSIKYPTGATDEFTYEEHKYGKINNTKKSSFYNKIQGRRLLSKIRRGNEVCQQTDYIYNLHDDNYNVKNYSSGVLTNPNFHCATYYTPGRSETDPYCSYMASKITSESSFNSYMGTPVFYTEVEEVEKDMDGNILSRNIHYYEPNIVNPPTNYIFANSSLVEITNKIFGEMHCYFGAQTFINGVNMTYLAYPVGEFCVDTYLGDQPLKEVFVGEDGRVRSIKRYNYRDYGTFTKYGYKIDKEESSYPNSYNVSSTIYRFCKSEYNTRRYRPYNTSTTFYFYNGEECDSICETSYIDYSKGRVSTSGFSRDDESSVVFNYFPDEITNIVANSSSAEINAINKLIEKNIIANPVKVVNRRNRRVIGGECSDYQVLDGIPLLKSAYKIKNTDNNVLGVPTINGNNIDYHVDIYKDGEILTYDEYHNPEHIRIKETQDRIYVWGYDGRFPVAIIDNMDYAAFSSNTLLKSMVRGLAQYRKIETEQECTNLRNANAAIRLQLPETAQITTFTYDPYFGITSEMGASNYGTVYTYDFFGRLTAKYDAYYKKLEEYTYNFYRQQ